MFLRVYGKCHYCMKVKHYNAYSRNICNSVNYVPDVYIKASATVSQIAKIQTLFC